MAYSSALLFDAEEEDAGLVFGGEGLCELSMVAKGSYPPHQRMYCLSPAEDRELVKQLEKLQQHWYIE